MEIYVHIRTDIRAGSVTSVAGFQCGCRDNQVVEVVYLHLNPRDSEKLSNNSNRNNFDVVMPFRT